MKSQNRAYGGYRVGASGPNLRLELLASWRDNLGMNPHAAWLIIAFLAVLYFFIGRSKDGGFTFWAIGCSLLVLGALWEVGRWLFS